jgi:predicted dithiol-disulfide oxidoreductase (DUF899 family)
VVGSAARAAKSGKSAHAARDELALRRQELPWVRIDKQYRFETDDGSASLADLFRAPFGQPKHPIRGIKDEGASLRA